MKITEITERKLSKGEKAKKERNVKKMKPHKKDFEKTYGKDGESVMYAVATKRAKNENVNEAPDNDPIIDSEYDPKTRMTYGVTKSGEKIPMNTDVNDTATATYDPVNQMHSKPDPKAAALPRKPSRPDPNAQKLHREFQASKNKRPNPNAPNPTTPPTGPKPTIKPTGTY